MFQVTFEFSFNFCSIVSFLMFAWVVYVILFANSIDRRTELFKLIAIIGMFITSGLFAVASIYFK